jgi:chemotaxis methyl-accepting protein methylase
VGSEFFGAGGSSMTSFPSAMGAAKAPTSSSTQPLIQIRDLIYRVAGIFQADNKLRLDDRCQKRMHALGVPNLRDYYECLTTKPIRQAEMVSLLNEITIGETCFFRNRP